MSSIRTLDQLPPSAVLLEQREIDASLLNLSGRQRMLSQRIALFLMRLASCGGARQSHILRQELQSLLEMLLSTHHALVHGNAELRLPSEHSAEIHRIYFAAPVHLDQHLTNYVETVKRFLAESDTTVSITNPTLQQLVNVDSVRLLQALETLVNQYTQESETRQIETMEQLIQLCEQNETALTTVSSQAEALNQTVNQLHQTQAKLLQSSKMVSLGHLVAGVAHEINNPVNFIHGNLQHVTAYTQDLIRLIRAYQTNYPEPAVEISEYCHEIDAEFLIHDLPKTVNSMRSGTQRLEQIVVSLRNFARLDESEFKSVNLYDGIDSTILLLQHRLHRFEQQSQQGIKIESDYAALPEVWCYASEINQVFMALLSNSIDALEAKSAQAHDKFAPEITIATQYVEAEKIITITISDNGTGIAADKIPQIFDPFFTTKPVGAGTGMGLAICYQIMEKHSGQISCESNLGVGTTFRITLPCPQAGLANRTSKRR